MDKAIKLYDQKLVFVADQDLRNKALIDEEADPNIDLLDLEYCILEKIGRSRDQGEITQSKIPLINDSKKAYHKRKILLNYSLIVQQNFNMKSQSSNQNISGGLVHLKRFYSRRETKPIVLMKRIANILRNQPNSQMEFAEFRQVFGRNVSLVKLMKSADFKRFFKLYAFPYRKFYPNATKHEYLSKNKQKERQVRVLRMLDPCANVTAIMDMKDTKELQQEKTAELGRHKLMNYEYLRDIFLYILSAGYVGVTIQEINNHFGMDFYSVRLAVRKLLLRNVIDSNKIDLGRQQSLKFFAKCFSILGHHINTQPKNYELSLETLSRVLAGYENKTVVDSESEPTKSVPIQTQFNLSFEPFCCTSFLTEMDSNAEDLTIYDIVIKGRDKLLLIGSNLFSHYISEWDEFLLKKDDFSKGIQLFQNGFGKVIYEFLANVRTIDIETDNCVVFSLENVKTNTKIDRFNNRRIIKIKKNYNNPHSNNVHMDTISKIYLFEAMSVSHYTNQVVEKLRNIFERVMINEGKRKRISVKLEPTIELEESGEIVMEKFMGPSPYLEFSEEQEGIKLEIFASSKPTCNKSGLFFVTEDENLTQRYINRANILLQSIYNQQVFKDVHSLYKIVLEEENLEGYDKKICKKTIISIIARLVDEGYIKVYKAVMTEKHLTKTQCFVCMLETDVHHTRIKSTIEQMKLKFCLAKTRDKPMKIKKKIESPFNMIDVKESIHELKQLTSVKLEPTFKFDKRKGKIYGYMPKFARMRILHEHLFYVIRELNEFEAISNRQVFELCKNLRIKVTQDEINDFPAIYRNEVSWKMFIPALPQNMNFPRGWALACDIILRMPLSVFVKLYNITYDIPGLETYLNHPIKRHFLLKHLPVDMRSILLRKRKYFYSIYENFCNMCYVGLLQLGPRNFKEKDQVFIYLNSRATLYDTCSSQPGYNMIEEKPYREILFEFKTESDVELYWSEMLRICMNTQLGKRKVLDGQCVTIEDCSAKPAMIATLRPKAFQEAVLDDTGAVLGDRRGAAGVDSSLWTFVKRNWAWSHRKKIQSQVIGLKKEMFDAVPIRFDLFKAQGGACERSNRSVKSVVVKRLKKKKVVRRIVAKKKRVRELYDAVDKSIMKKNALIRVEWDEEEDQLLRYSRAAAAYLCPEYKKHFIPYNVIRDVLHRICPKTRNKTAKAIQRRTYVLLTNDETIKIMENNTENFSNSETISKYFDQIRNRYKNEIKITDSQIYICYIYLMSYISKHRKEIELLLLGYFATFDFFAKANISEFETILQNCDASNPIYTDPKTVEDVTKDTIRSVVHCSMACKKNCVGWTFHLSRIYKKFQDELIRTTVATLKKDQFLVTNKNNEGKNIDGNWPTPLKFSHVYNLMKSSIYTNEMFQEAFRVFLAKIEGDLEAANFMVCNELNTYWEQIRFIFEIPEMGIILNPEIEDHSEVIDELAKRFHLYLDKIYEKKNAGRNFEVTRESVNEVEDCEKIKNKVRQLIFRVPYLLEGELEMYFKKMLDSNSNLEINNYIYLMIVNLKKFTEGRNTTDDLRNFVANIEEESEEKLLKNLSKVVFVIQTIHQQQVETNLGSFEAWESDIWDEVRSKNDESNSLIKSPKNYASGMEVCIKRAQAGDFPSIDEIKEGMMVEIDGENRKIPHITDLIMLLNEGRFPELDTDNDIEKMKEHFVMQYPKLDQFVIEDLEKMKQHEVTLKITNCTKIETITKMTENVIKPPQMDLLIKYLIDVNGSEDDIKIVENLIDFVKEKKELGVSGPELKQNFLNKIELNLAQLMDYLNEIGVILRAGVASIIYVHYEYQSEWLTETFMLSPEEKQIYESTHFISSSLESRKVQLKPWTKLDGSLNDDLFHEWLCLILSRCIDLPNIPFRVLCEYFHYIKPVDIFSLLEVLQELACVKIYFFDTGNHNLCSTRCVVQEREATSLDSFDEMFIKPTNVSGLCFGSFLDKLQLHDN
ncbi:uncharacterized protein LOC123011855 isoform X2 [Tribolium madens]|nr:uncharacterized protein LOC123011855 isoform X2 [Tribolium madens]